MKRNTSVFLMRRALQLFSSADYTGAHASCRELLALDSANSSAWNLLGKIASISDNAAAIDYFGTCVELSPQDARFRYDFAKILLENGDYSKAFCHALEAFNIEPTNSDYCFILALCIESFGDRGSAISLYEFGLNLTKPTSAILAGLGGMLMRDEQMDRAMIVINRALCINPVSVDSYYLHAKCCNIQGYFNNGLSSATIAADLIKDEPLVYCELALSMLGLNNRNSALIWVERALSLDMNCSQALHVKSLLQKSELM